MKQLLTEKTDYFASKEYAEVLVERSLRRLAKFIYFEQEVPLKIIKNEMEILEKRIIYERTLK